MHRFSTPFLTTLALVFVALSGSAATVVYLLLTGASPYQPAADREDHEVPGVEDLRRIRLDHAREGLVDPALVAAVGGATVFVGLGVGTVALIAARGRAARPEA